MGPVERRTLAACAAATVVTAAAAELNSPSQLATFRGQLLSAQAPAYDGPVKWEAQSTTGLSDLFLAGAVLGAAGAAIGALRQSPRDQSANRTEGELSPAVIGAAVGGVVGFTTAGYQVTQNPRVIEFTTTIRQVISANTPEHPQNLTLERAMGWPANTQPGADTQRARYPEFVTIPETDLRLEVSPHGSTFTAGMKINATFHLDPTSDQILSWSATPVSSEGEER